MEEPNPGKTGKKPFYQIAERPFAWEKA